MNVRLQGRLVDRVRIYARGGAGGQGSQRLGGIGGDGGSVKVVCTQGSALEDIARRESRRFIAESGGHSVRGMVWGKKGRNLIITVPPGTVVQGSRGIEVSHPDTHTCTHTHTHTCTKEIMYVCVAL